MIIFNNKKNYKVITVMLITLTLFGMSLPAFAASSPFADVASSFWAYEDIEKAYNNGVMTGTGYTDSGTPVFSANDNVTMAQFVTILTRAFYGGEVEASTAAGKWYAKNYAVAGTHSLFSSVVNTDGNTDVTREVMAQLMYNVMADKGVSLPTDQELQAMKNKIPDFKTVSTSFGDAVAASYQLGLITGMDAKGSFAPKDLMTRAQTAVIYNRLDKAIGESHGNSTTTPGSSTSNPLGPGQDPFYDDETSNNSTLTNGKAITEENVLALMEEYKNGKAPGTKAQAAGFTSYKNFATYDAYNPTYNLAPFGNGTECAKFAFAFWDDLFGGNASIREITNYEDIRPGDLIHFPGHWAITTSAAFSDSDGDLWIRTVSGNASGRVGWANVDEAIINAAGSRLDGAWTRYPTSTSTPSSWKFDKSEYEFSIEAPLGTAIEDFDLDDFILVSATRGSEHKQFQIPVIWYEPDYEAWESGVQTISGRLDLSEFPELEGAESPALWLTITLG